MTVGGSAPVQCRATRQPIHKASAAFAIPQTSTLIGGSNQVIGCIIQAKTGG